jgi:hypothetical protein
MRQVLRLCGNRTADKLDTLYLVLHSVNFHNHWFSSYLRDVQIVAKYSSELLPLFIRGPFVNFVEVRWRSPFRSTSLDKRCTSYNAPPTSRKRAADRWSLRNFLPRSSLFMVRETQKSHGARSELNSVFSLEKVDRWNPITISATQSTSRPMRFLGFSKHEKGAPRQEISKWSTVCITFSRSGWSVERSASLAKGSTSKKRPSPCLHKVPTRSNKVSPRTLQTARTIWLIHSAIIVFIKMPDFRTGSTSYTENRFP